MTFFPIFGLVSAGELSELLIIPIQQYCGVSEGIGRRRPGKMWNEGEKM